VCGFVQAAVVCRVLSRGHLLMPHVGACLWACRLGTISLTAWLVSWVEARRHSSSHIWAMWVSPCLAVAQQAVEPYCCMSRLLFALLPICLILRHVSYSMHSQGCKLGVCFGACLGGMLVMKHTTRGLLPFQAHCPAGSWCLWLTVDLCLHVSMCVLHVWFSRLCARPMLCAEHCMYLRYLFLLLHVPFMSMLHCFGGMSSQGTSERWHGHAGSLGRLARSNACLWREPQHIVGCWPLGVILVHGAQRPWHSSFAVLTGTAGAHRGGWPLELLLLLH